jgi:peptidoglycan/xylan/chitin deacetylase (PgdA/CDA1 family)/dephospho-CoA kinase
MILELTGLPGAGKTTLASALKTRGVQIIGTTGGWRALLHTFLFWFWHPVVAVRLARYVYTHAPREMRYSILMNGVVLSSSKFLRARRVSTQGNIALIDQGFSQLVISVPGLPEKLIALLPRPDILVVVETPRATRFERMYSRGRVPRGEEAASWDTQAEESLAKALPIFSNIFPDVLRVSGEDVETAIRSLRTHVTQGTTLRQRRRSVLWYVRTGLKHVAYVIAALFAVGMRREKGALVLMYHSVDRSSWKLSVSPQMFAWQMAYLQKHYNPTTLSDVIAFSRGEKEGPSRAVAVSFDDGYADFLPTVLPLLQKYHIPATLFLSTNTDAYAALGEPQRISWGEAKTLSQSGFVQIESHGETHAHLPQLSQESLVQELSGSRSVIEKNTGYTPRFFAYPFGDRSKDVEKAVAQAGYNAAFGISDGFVGRGSDSFRLPRIQVDGTMSKALFALRLTPALIVHKRILGAFRWVISTVRRVIP